MKPAGTITRREAMLIIVVGMVLAAYFTWPMALRPASLGRVAMGDGQFSIWNVAWVAHALVTPGETVFDANIFHPHRGTLAYSEPNLGAGLLAVPAYLLTGGNPYAAHNSAVLIGLTFSFVGMYLLARRLTGSREGALVAAIVFAFCPFYFARTAHIQLMMMAPLPFTLLAFHDFSDAPSIRTAAFLGLWLAVQALFCSYYGVLAGLLVGLGVLVVAILDGRLRQPRWWGLSVAAAVIAVVTVLPMFLPYLELQSNTGFGRSLDDSRRYSADWRAYFASSAWAHAWMLPYLGRWSEVLFPGFTALLVGGFGLVAGLEAVVRRGQGGFPTFPMGRGPVIFYLLVFGLALWSSFGPPGGLYSVLYYTIPVFSLLRAPARFGLAVTLALSVFTAAGVALILNRVPRARWVLVTGVLAAMAIAELSTTIPYLPAREVPRAYKVLAAAESGPVVEFPFYYRPDDRYRQTLYMLGSTAHWRPLVNGYSDFIPADVLAAGPLLEHFPNAEGFAWLRERGTRYVVFHLGLYDTESQAQLLGRIDEHAAYLKPKYTYDTVLLYEIVWPAVSP